MTIICWIGKFDFDDGLLLGLKWLKTDVTLVFNVKVLSAELNSIDRDEIWFNKILLCEWMGYESLILVMEWTGNDGGPLLGFEMAGNRLNKHFYDRKIINWNELNWWNMIS